MDGGGRWETVVCRFPWAPWALPRAAEILRPILRDMEGRWLGLDADDVAHLLMVTNWERTGQEFKTIGACDIPPEIRKGIARNEKRRKDRDRLTAKRRQAGVQPRQSWLNANKLSERRPWEAAGISRSKWYRDQGRTGPSRVGNKNPSGETAVPNPLPLGAMVVDLAGSVVTGFLKSHSAIGGKVTRDVEEELNAWEVRANGTGP